jgi:hypothetical protein
MIGALVSVRNIPQYMLQNVLLVRPVGRPDFIVPSKGCIKKIIKLTEIAPTELKLIKTKDGK